MRRRRSTRHALIVRRGLAVPSATVQRLLADLQGPLDIGADVMASVGASIGVAFFPADGRDADALTKVADQRMFEAKRSGGNRIVSTSDAGMKPYLQVVAKN